MEGGEIFAMTELESCGSWVVALPQKSRGYFQPFMQLPTCSRLTTESPVLCLWKDLFFFKNKKITAEKVVNMNMWRYLLKISDYHCHRSIYSSGKKKKTNWASVSSQGFWVEATMVLFSSLPFWPGKFQTLRDLFQWIDVTQIVLLQ